MVLLAYLAVEGPQPRARLARLFWPDASDPRNRLSVALHRIERDLPDVVHADAEVVAARIPTDVANVREALSRDDVERARELYGGTFLAGVVVPNVSPELEAWTVEVAEELADLLRDRLLRAGSRAGLQRRYPRAARHAEMAMQVSGARAPEPELLAQWHALALAGGSDVAVRLRREADELGLTVATTPAEARAHLMAAMPRSNLPRETSTFVGRARERVELGRLLGDPGRPVVTILGPGGMGKTRLALGLARDQLATPTFAGGVFFVPLETVDRPEEIPNAVATTGPSAARQRRSPRERRRRDRRARSRVPRTVRARDVPDQARARRGVGLSAERPDDAGRRRHARRSRRRRVGPAVRRACAPLTPGLRAGRRRPDRDRRSVP